MVLTNMLPNQGNGAFVFHMWAKDREGNSVLSGNADDDVRERERDETVWGDRYADARGGGVGRHYAVFGWVLSRQARADPPVGGTVTVQVDGVTVGSPGGWAARPDLTRALPVYPGINGASGVYGLNTLA